MQVIKLREMLDTLERRVGMYTMSQSFSEVCAFLDGFDMCSDTATMNGFRTWLGRRGKGPKELTWWGLVLCEVDPTLKVSDVRSFSPERHQEAVAALFSLLRDYLRTLGSD
ncbi:MULTISPECIES: hypothetical protein [unclassified Streptomyces]|uniref:hypothetical protein n=1 Tax=unclassified Streptomyces TaxID=2593676 RepID=UPI00343A13AE